MANRRLSIHSIKATHQAAAECVVFILELELAITYSDWRASIRHLKTLCNWCLSAGCLWICGAQINTIQLHVCIAVIVMQSGDGKVAETLMFLYFRMWFILSGGAAPSSLLNWNLCSGSLYVHFMECRICYFILQVNLKVIWDLWLKIHKD